MSLIQPIASHDTRLWLAHTRASFAREGSRGRPKRVKACPPHPHPPKGDGGGLVFVKCKELRNAFVTFAPQSGGRARPVLALHVQAELPPSLFFLRKDFFGEGRRARAEWFGILVCLGRSIGPEFTTTNGARDPLPGGA